MREAKLALAAVCALLAFGAGCGSDSSDGGGSGGGAGSAGAGGGAGTGGSSVTLGEYFSVALQLECKKSIECCTDAEIDLVFSKPVSDVVACSEKPQNGDALVNALLQPSIDSGRLKFDAAKASACLAALDALSCAVYATHEALFGSDFCDSPLLPQQGDGDPCSQSHECTSGNCIGATLGQDGQCQPMPGSGEQCEDDCASGFYCDSATCAALKADGETCFLGAECQSTHCEDQGSGAQCVLLCDGK